MKKYVTMDGNEACSYASYPYTEVAGIYPITPSSPMAEHIDEWSGQGKKNVFNDTVKVVEMQSEAGAAGFVHGSLVTGFLTSTYTASQGLLLMIPNLYKMAGEMLPGVIHVAARSLSTHALSILGDHQDIYAARATGTCMLASSNVQDAHDLSVVAHLSSLEASLPFLHFFDGFRTSHEINKIYVLEDSDYAEMLDRGALEKFRKRAMNPNTPNTRGTAQNDDIYFQVMESKNKYYDAVGDIVVRNMNKINEKMGRNLKPFNYYGDESAKHVIVAMGSVNETIKATIDDLNKKDYHVGLVEVHLYRPFMPDYLNEVLPKTVEKVAVLDRTKEPGSFGEPLYLDVKASLPSNIQVYGGRYGLSSKNTTPRDIKAVYDFLNNEPHHNFTIGIKDDVTKLSLDSDLDYTISSNKEMLIYGYGSDGMVSASKSLIKIVGDHTDNYVQGYFQYDSKKSGGVTISHLRFDSEMIRAPYYVENPELIVISKDSYLKEFDVYSKIKENGTFLINTVYNEEELNKIMPTEMKRIIKERNCKVYIINAYYLAYKHGLKNKISMIMEQAILNLIGILNKEEAHQYLVEGIKDKFYKKGEEVVHANIEGIQSVETFLKRIDVDQEETFSLNKSRNVIQVMMAREGNELPTSAFVNHTDGVFPAATTKLESRGISETVPSWISSNCINCNQCSLVCPHGVIRPYLLSEEEYSKAPEIVKKRAVKPFGRGLENYYYILGISIKNCTGCGLCIETCPGFKLEKALTPHSLGEETKQNIQEIFDYLNNNISYKKEIENTLFTVKGSQFKKPKFEFSGACAGCGETAYIKLLTQLFGDEIVISNATGCSSIYGASAPMMPYSVPWASSLFEDNAEYGYGMLTATVKIRERIANIMKDNLDNPNQTLFKEYIGNINSYEITKKVYEELDYNTVPEELLKLKEYIKVRSIWTIGGDGWAYDIGFGGLDHVLSTGDNVKILVLDSEVYSNTGGQASKATPTASIASFASHGKKNAKKDLARMMMAYPNVYIAQVNLGANQAQTIKAFKEAMEYDGPALIIAYSPCISHGIKGGMEQSLHVASMATECGYFPIFRYVPNDKKFYLDSKRIKPEIYEEFLDNQNRYRSLKQLNKEEASALLEQNKENALERFSYYEELSQK